MLDTFSVSEGCTVGCSRDMFAADTHIASLGCGLGWAQGIVLDWDEYPPWEGAILRGKGQPIVKYRGILL